MAQAQPNMLASRRIRAAMKGELVLDMEVCTKTFYRLRNQRPNTSATFLGTV